MPSDTHVRSVAGSTTRSFDRHKDARLQDLLEVGDWLTGLLDEVPDVVVLVLLEEAEEHLHHPLLVVPQLLALCLHLGHLELDGLAHLGRQLQQRLPLDAQVEVVRDGAALGALHHLPLHR